MGNCGVAASISQLWGFHARSVGTPGRSTRASLKGERSCLSARMEHLPSPRNTSPTRMPSTHGYRGRGGSTCVSSFNISGATLATVLTEEAIRFSSFVALQELTVDAEARAGLHVHDENWLLVHSTPHWHTHRVTGLLIDSSMYTSISAIVTTPHAASV
eukprot:5138770-Amphidinium_carterae.1